MIASHRTPEKWGVQCLELELVVGTSVAGQFIPTVP
jgi:hypothetical protein